MPNDPLSDEASENVKRVVVAGRVLRSTEVHCEMT